MTATPPRLGRYLLISEVARGSFGRLWTACTRLDSGKARAVLMRRVPKGPPLDSAALEQIGSAARRCTSAYGEHVARALGVEETDEEIAIVFEYADGRDLRSILSLASIRRQRIPAAVALQIAACSLEGLAELRGDFPEELRSAALCPDSVFVATDGRVTLLDAPVAAAIAHAPGARSFRKLISYSAPEELEAGADLAQSDVFRAGVLLWEMISGKRLFRSTTKDIRQLERSPVPPLEALAPEHAPLAEIVARALEGDRAARYASTDDLHAVLDDCGIGRASKDEVAAFIAELLGSGISVQQRAIALALERLIADDGGAEQSKAGSHETVVAAPPTRSAKKTLLGVPAPAVLPARPARPRLPLPPPRPPPTPGRALLGSSPLVPLSMDEVESTLPSETVPERIADAEVMPLLAPPSVPTTASVRATASKPEPASAPEPPTACASPMAPAQDFAQELAASAPEAMPRARRIERRHVVAASAALAVLLLGAGVLALVGLRGGSHRDPEAGASASASASASVATPEPTAASEPATASDEKPEAVASSKIASRPRWSALDPNKPKLTAKKNKPQTSVAAAKKKQQSVAAKKKKPTQKPLQKR